MKRFLQGFGLAILAVSCHPTKDSTEHKIQTGTWRAAITLQQQELPFTFDLLNDSSGEYDVVIRNAEERLLLDEIDIFGDSINMTLHIFDANIKGLIKDNRIEGVFIKNYEKDFKVPFTAEYGEHYRFRKTETTKTPDFSGKYSVTFVHETDTTPAIGIFKQQGDHITGTFLTPTGDYRFLEGDVVNDTMKLSTFDGNHAYLFTAVKTDANTLSGKFYSGKAWREDWTASRNDRATLPDAESLTYLKPGYNRIDFSFPSINGETITLRDVKYRNKVVILQLFGTWCPNCMDETQFLSSWYQQNRHRGVEIIGLAYERKDDVDYARTRIEKMIERFDIEYDIAIAGTNDKEKASATLPMLNRVVAFPTTIFIGKDGTVKKIHTGFSGPGTGVYYQQFMQQFNETVNELLRENLTSKK